MSADGEMPTRTNFKSGDDSTISTAGDDNGASQTDSSATDSDDRADSDDRSMSSACAVVQRCALTLLMLCAPPSARRREMRSRGAVLPLERRLSCGAASTSCVKFWPTVQNVSTYFWVRIWVNFMSCRSLRLPPPQGRAPGTHASS